MGEELTTRQRRILEFIRDAVNERGYPPSIREICDEVGLTSTSSVHSQLQTLEKKGFIRRDPTKPRAIEVYVEGPAPVVPRPLPAYAPLLSGPIAAGTGVLPDDQIEEMLPLPRDLVGQGELFVLRVTAENGDIVAALVPNLEDEATVKTWSMKNGHVRLMPANPAYDPIDGDAASVLGKVVAVLRRL